ncbi:MAG: VacB/RNase II family 3'-5' exoribonuclease [bacterium]
MRVKEITNSVLDCLKTSAPKPLSAADIADSLQLRGQARKHTQKLLHRLVVDGEVAVRGNRYVVVAATAGKVLTGRITIVRSGDGFLATGDGTEDIRITARNLGTALPGDTVEVDLGMQRGRGRGAGGEPRVVRVVERGRKEIVGTLKTSGRFLYVVPIDAAYERWFKVGDSSGAKLDDRVVVEFVRWDNRDDYPEGRIIEVIGSANVASFDTQTILRHYNYKEEFPGNVLREAESVKTIPANAGRRLDLRDKFIFTIDPVTARDFDDALSLETDPQGNRVLGVHIADVAFFVRSGTPLDVEARRRGNSVYFPDKVIPMLPHALSSGACSLVPDEDRLAFSVFITVDRAGSPIKSTFGRSIIRSRLRLTYEQAMSGLSVPDGQACRKAGMTAENVRLAKDINRLAQQFRRRRFAAGALDLDMPDYEIVLRPDGSVADVRQVLYDQSHQLVEECMVAANEAVDQELSNRGIALVHRIHESPVERKLEDLSAKLIEMGFKPGDLRRRDGIVKFLHSVEGSPLLSQVRTAVLRSMCKAVYSASPKGHFGLSKRFYAHFTSPIRRYPDLVVHRILAAALESAPSPYRIQELTGISDECSQTEQQAEMAERSLLEIKKYRFLEQELSDRKAQPHDAVIVKVAAFGMFVELIKLQVQGLVHNSTIGKRVGTRRSLHHAARDGHKTYKTGGVVKVYVTKVDFDHRRIDFSIA